jgi:NAD(P)-dependent dehydrogenase (short-subunit alcohol dehydrogenase family)
MTRRLENKTALVTGSTSNIGREVAVAFGGEGAHVIVSGRGDARGQAVVARIRDAGGKADYVHADLDGAVASRALAEEAAGLLGGRIDILVNNAGIFPGHTTLTTDEDTFDRVCGHGSCWPVRRAATSRLRCGSVDRWAVPKWRTRFLRERPDG